ncbi:NHL domain-containing protein [Trifolium repens]|nr:NHL domain-containing protein [Trifolium repens]
MTKNYFMLAFAFVVLFGLLSPTSATPPPAKIVTGVVSNVVSTLFKWIWSQKSKPKVPPVQHSRSMVKFESGYNVETIFDGSKLGIEPYSIEISPDGEFFILDSESSNIYKISSPISKYNKPKLLAGSSEGYIGHIDGRPRDARLNHPKGITVDDSGNIYIADTLNMAIRKISDEGVTTIAGGGKRGQVGGHVDGPSEDAKFSNDFDVVYVRTSCSLLVVDRGNQAIREIQLNQHDCTTTTTTTNNDEYEFDNSFPLGIAALVCAGFFGYMLALLKRRVKDMFSSSDDSRAPINTKGTPFVSQQRPPPKSVRPPLIPNEDEFEKHDEGFFVSLGRLLVNSSSTMGEIFLSLFLGSKRKPLSYHQYQQQQQYHYANRHHSNSWPMQESFVIPDGDEPPPNIETKTPTQRKTYPYTNKELEMLDNGYDEQQQQHYQQQQHHQQQPQHHSKVQSRYSSTTPSSYYEKNCETNEIVFGAVQEHDGRREAMVIKAVDYGDPKFSHHNIRPRLNYVGYSHNY